MENYVGRCKYCGYEMTVLAYSQQAADAEAERACGCDGAQKAFKKARFADELEMLAGARAEEKNFVQVSPEVYGVIKKTGNLIIDGEIRSAAFKVDGTTINITATGDKVKVKRVRKHEETGEI